MTIPASSGAERQTTAPTSPEAQIGGRGGAMQLAAIAFCATMIGAVGGYAISASQGPAPQAAIDTEVVPAAKFDELQDRYLKLVASVDTDEAAIEVKRLVAEVERLESLNSEATELMRRVIAEEDAARNAGVGLSLTSFCQYFNEDRGWVPTAAATVEDGVRLTFECKLNEGVGILLSGNPSNFSSITMILGGSLEAAVKGFAISCEVLDAISPWSDDEVLQWLAREAEKLDRGENPEPMYRQGFRIGMGDINGATIIHLKKEDPPVIEKSL